MLTILWMVSFILWVVVSEIGAVINAPLSTWSYFSGLGVGLMLGFFVWWAMESEKSYDT